MAIAGEGVRVRLFPDWAEDSFASETVVLALPAGLVGPGPSDPWMYVIDALGKPPYDPPGFTPPYLGPRRAPALPDRHGHFDRIALEDPTFASAHLYGIARFALDVWEKYLCRKIRWRSANLYPILELIPQVDWDNAQSGPGFLETGARRNQAGALQPFCMNFDVVAHEMGHTILFAEIGVPPPQLLSSEFLAFHEAISDIMALVAMMHFESVLDAVLRKTHGNLCALNMLNRFGILSQTEQIRVCDNTVKMEDVEGLRMGANGDWIDPAGKRRNAHDLAAPLTGAMFDLLVELFQDGLVARGLIGADIDVRNWSREQTEEELAIISRRFGDRFAQAAPLFHSALLDARDILGAGLAGMFEMLDPEALSFDRAAQVFLLCLREIAADCDIPRLADNFTWRGIDVGPALRLDSAGRPFGVAASRAYADRVAAGKSMRARSDDRVLNAGLLHRLINHDQRGDA
jgi:hypothetical protein